MVLVCDAPVEILFCVNDCLQISSFIYLFILRILSDELV